MTDFKKRLDGDTPSPENSPPPSRNIGSGSGYNARPPARHPRDSVYDADPRVIGDDFAHLELRDNTEGKEALAITGITTAAKWKYSSSSPSAAYC